MRTARRVASTPGLSVVRYAPALSISRLDGSACPRDQAVASLKVSHAVSSGPMMVGTLPRAVPLTPPTHRRAGPSASIGAEERAVMLVDLGVVTGPRSDTIVTP